MRSSLAFLGSTFLVTALALWSGCKGGSPATGTGTTTTKTTSTVIGAGGGSASTCAGPMADGLCEPAKGEDCNCIDCQVTAMCNPGQCGGASGCDHMLDSCTCASCAEDAFCGDPALGNCAKDAGACDPVLEGCHCPNCWADDACKASVAACSGGKPDGKCDRNTEDCSCVDCQGTPLCVPCLNSGVCGPNEPCYCADCAHAKTCNDPMRCKDDGVCATLSEGCQCNDCKDLPECAPWVSDAGTDAADEGG